VILQAMRTHGLVVADNGSSGFIGGVPDERWDNHALHQLRRVTLADFEAVDTAPLRISAASAAARGAARPAETLAATAAGSLGDPATGPGGGPVAPEPAAGAAEAGAGDALLPRVLTVILGLIAATLAMRIVRRSRSGPPDRRR
jgi:hypothetical protein